MIVMLMMMRFDDDDAAGEGDQASMELMPAMHAT